MLNKTIYYMLFFNVACNGYKEEKFEKNPIATAEPSQSKKAALTILCDLPEDITADPTRIGSYVSKKITNEDVLALVSTINDPAVLYLELKNNGIDTKGCDALKPFLVDGKEPEEWKQ